MARSRDAVKERYWRGVFRRYESSQFSVRRFCAREGLPEHRFHWWRRALRVPRRQARSVQHTPPRRPIRQVDGNREEQVFLPVTVPFAVGAPIEVVHPRGYVIRVPAVFEPSALSGIVAALDDAGGWAQRGAT